MRMHSFFCVFAYRTFQYLIGEVSRAPPNEKLQLKSDPRDFTYCESVVWILRLLNCNACDAGLFKISVVIPPTRIHQII